MASARIIHPLGQHHIQGTSLSFYRTKREPEISHGHVQDNGIPPDSAAGDSLFTGFLEFSIVRSEIGFFYAEVVASDAEGYRSNSIRVPFTLLRLNQPPVLSNLLAPDTVHLSLQNSFLVSVRATDSNGQGDILSVTMTNSNNTIFSLNDEGRDGDIASGDGIFSQIFSLPPDTPPDSYSFTFRAVDRSNASSQIITKIIVVAP